MELEKVSMIRATDRDRGARVATRFAKITGDARSAGRHEHV